MPKGSYFTEREIAMILSAICFFKSEGENANAKRYPVYKKVSQCLGISLASVKRAGALNKVNNEENQSPTSRKRQCFSRGRPRIDLDDFTLAVIRRTIYDFYMKKIFPTIENLHGKLKENMNDFPEMSASTLNRIVHKLGFKFKKFNKKPILMESTEIAASRHSFLRKLKSLRSQGFKIFYTDETWCGQNHSMTYGWQERVVDDLNRDFNNYDMYRKHIQEVYGWRGGFKTPSGAGKRVIILHIGSKDGFLPGAELCFVGRKGSSDYHDEMNSAHFEEWFLKVLILLPHKSAVVIDQAPYHTRIEPTTKNPSVWWKKADIISWLMTKNITPPPCVENYSQLTKSELILYAKPHFGTPQKKLEIMVTQIRPDVELVWLPVAHCELNAIELIWANIKGKVAKINIANAAEKGRNMEIIKELCVQALRSVTPELWEKCIQHTQKIESHYWEKDELPDYIPPTEPIIINMHSDSESYSESELSDDS